VRAGIEMRIYQLNQRSPNQWVLNEIMR